MQPNSIWHNQMTPSANCTPCSSTATTASSSSSGSCTVSFPRSRLRHGYCVNQQHQIGVPPSLPAVVLLPEGSLNGGMFSSTVGVESSGHRLVRDMSMDVQSPGMECSSGGSCFGGQLQRPQSRSPSASSLNAYSSRHSSPNPSPPLTGQHQQKVMSPRSPSNIGGAASVARMMSALLKQQNSIAEEEDSLLLVEDDDAADVEIGQAATNASSLEARLNCPNGMPSHIGTPPIVGAVDQPKNWLAPPLDFVLLGGSISPPPVRMHPVTDHEPRREFHSHDGGLQLADPAAARSVLPCTSSQMGTVTESAVKQHKYHHNHHRHHHHPGTNEEKFHRQQSQPTWTRGIGANSKHRKGSLSPNNSLRYSTLMAAARRNHFQQQRTTSEATPAQRDLLMADVLGHGIRDKFCCASISAPSPQLSQECNEGGGDSIVSSSKVLARFEVGAGDSSASSLNNHGSSSANATPCSQCSSTNSLLHFQHCCVGSIKHKQHQQAAQRSCTATGDSGGKAESGSGSLPKLVALVPSAFPPSSVMLSSNSNELLANTNSSGGGGTSQQSSIAGVGTKKRRKSRANTSTQQQQQQHQQTPVGKQCQDQTQPANLLLCPPDQQRYMSGNSDAIATGSSSESGAAAVLRRDPARWNLAATKQRSSSETTFINMVSSTHVADDAPSVVAQHQCSCCNMCKSTSADGSHRCVHVPYVHVEPVPSGFTAVRAVSLGMASAGAPPSSGDRTVSGGKPHCPLAHACNGTLRRPDSLSALGRSGYKHCAAIAMLNNNSVFMQNNAQREQAILQRILGPTGLGWLKQQRRLESDPLLKKSLSLVLTDDVEAQRTGAVSAAPGGTASGGNAPSEKGGAHGSLLNNDGVSACSAKQSLVKDKERGGRFIKRQQLFSKRRVTSDYALFFAIFGIVLMIIENEFVYAEFTSVCVLLKLVILLSTICLVGLVVKFHVHEIQIFMNANSAEDWQIALTCRKSMQIVVEIIACAICPLPIKLDVFVSTVNSDGHTVPMRMPLDVLFSILMFFRLYWLCRVMLLHSRLFTDAASRSIAGLNRVKTDAKFILKTLMTICPGTMLLLFTASLWMIGGYILRLCERHHEQHDDASLLHNNMQANKHQSYLNSLWLIAVTFLSIGYGDIVPNTQCGRIMAVVTGILGTCTSSMVVAVIARKLELTRAEKHVHNFMIETQHTKQLKHIAANVLRETWLIYKHRCLVDKIEPRKIRHHQRKFLVAICALRKLKTSQRKLDENRISLGDVAKTTSHSHDLMREVHSTQEGLALRITAVEHQLSDIQREVGSIADMLRCALRPSPGPVDQQQMMELCPVRQRRKPSMIGDA